MENAVGTKKNEVREYGLGLLILPVALLAATCEGTVEH